MAPSKITVALLPNDAQALINPAAIVQPCAQLARAVVCLLREIELDPDRVEVFNNLGNVFDRQCRSAEADDCYLNALALKPTLAYVTSNRRSNFQNRDDSRKHKTATGKLWLLRQLTHTFWSTLARASTTSVN